MESATTVTTNSDDPIKRMIWSLQADNKARYPKRLKVVLDYLGLTKPGDEDYEALRIAAIQFIKMIKENPEWVEGRLIDFIAHQYQRVERGEIKPVTIGNYTKGLKLFCGMITVHRMDNYL